MRKPEFVFSLYNAVAHQLKINGETPFSLHDLRTKTADYLRENMNDFLPFLSNPDSDDLLTPEEYEKYCNDVAETSAWGGAVEVSIHCKLHIIIIICNNYEPVNSEIISSLGSCTINITHNFFITFYYFFITAAGIITYTEMPNRGHTSYRGSLYHWRRIQ